MFSTTLRVGEAIEIGDQAAVRVEAKSGCMVKLAFFTSLPLRVIVDGIIPPRYTYGLEGPPRRVLEDVRHTA
jgi:hypothetical protein